MDAGRELIAQAIVEAEKMTNGEIRVHLTRNCPEDVMTHAQKVFSRLKMQDTKERNAVLIFVATQSKKFAILGDRGIHTHVGEDYWQKTRDLMFSYFSKNQISEGIVAGILSVGEKLKKHFPAAPHDKNELSNKVTED